jgi:transposase
VAHFLCNQIIKKWLKSNLSKTTTLQIFDRSTGDTIPAYVFIATLPYSQFSYVEAFLDMKSANWLIAHIHALEYFGGVPETLVPDNLKTGVTKAH